MTRAGDLFVANIDTTVDEALEILVDKRITGMPVVDENRTLVCQFLCLQVLHLVDYCNKLMNILHHGLKVKGHWIVQVVWGLGSASFIVEQACQESPNMGFTTC
jgi:hypothetical protein